jgi:hypothetical protein
MCVDASHLQRLNASIYAHAVRLLELGEQRQQNAT